MDTTIYFISRLFENPFRVIGAAMVLIIIGCALKLGIHASHNDPANMLASLIPDLRSTICEVLSPLFIKAGEIIGVLGVGYLVLLIIF